VTSFLDPLRHRLTQALTQFNRDLPRNPHVHLSLPAANEDRRLFSVAPLVAQPELQSLGHLKDLISQRYGMLDLLDTILEPEHLVDFTRFFTHSGTKEVRPRDVLRPLLLLDLFAEGTNTGSKRVANANQRYGFHELLYVRKHYCSADALRSANAAVVNKILAWRNPQLWGDGYSCASDGKRFESSRQNLMTEWRSHYNLFESNRHRPYSTRRLRQLAKQYALAAGITKRIYPYLFRHQLLTHLTRQGIVSPKLQLLSGHTTEQSLAVYRALALSDVAAEYEAAMRIFPIR
jgi:integrase/recombinase XerD